MTPRSNSPAAGPPCATSRAGPGSRCRRPPSSSAARARSPRPPPSGCAPPRPTSPSPGPTRSPRRCARAGSAPWRCCRGPAALRLPRPVRARVLDGLAEELDASAARCCSRASRARTPSARRRTSSRPGARRRRLPALRRPRQPRASSTCSPAASRSSAPARRCTRASSTCSSTRPPGCGSRPATSRARPPPGRHLSMPLLPGSAHGRVAAPRASRERLLPATPSGRLARVPFPRGDDAPASGARPRGRGRVGGRAPARRARAPRPTAIVAQSDVIAAGVIRAAEDLGLRVPEDLTVTGFDGVDLPWLAHRLTTMDQPGPDKGRAMGRLVRRALEGAPIGDEPFPVRLRVGTTTSSPPSVTS